MIDWAIGWFVGIVSGKALAAGFSQSVDLSEPTALAAGCSLVNCSINSGPKLALTVHNVSTIWLTPSGLRSAVLH